MRKDSHNPADSSDADVTPGIRDEPEQIEEEDQATNIGALADGGSASPAHDALDMESGIVGGTDQTSHTGIGAGNLAAKRKEEA
ncbi:MAG TPA: hypothetical protein VGE01_05555 [Fimbriimonas sp.]